MQPHTQAGSDAVGQIAADVSRHANASGAEGKKGGGEGGELPPGPCHDMAGLVRDFFALPDNRHFGPASCGADEKGAALEAQAGQNVRFIIATLPDPIHTHLPLVFDRNADAIQEAAQDAGYTYDSSWFPWQQKENEPALLADKDVLDQRRRLREDQPGIFLFRKAITQAGHTDPFHDALIVFVVGDEATSGVSLTQFHNAVEWIARVQPVQGAQPASAVQILGPTFSGSLPSLAKALAQNLDSGEASQTVLVPRTLEQRLDVYSGGIKSFASATWFHAEAEQAPLKALRIRFHSFQQDNETTQNRYIGYLDSIGIGGCHLAIVTEDETAFGSAYRSTGSTAPDPNQNLKAGQSPFCDYAADAPDTKVKNTDALRERFSPTVVYYPRDISALRAAYQEQSVFGHGSSQAGADNARHTLRSDLSDPDAVSDGDSVHRYGGNQTALSEEAILLQIVSILRFHETQFILIRSSNTLDQLFLSEFFKHTYPEGRVVILDSDLLLRRDVGSNGMNGVTVLGTYPLLPGSDHWTAKLVSHQHRAFPQNNVMGTYVALRFLLRTPRTLPSHKPVTAGEKALVSCLNAQDTQLFVPPTCGDVEIPTYAPPVWIQSDQALRKGPQTWLSVLGNDGFWPVAVLDDRPLSSPDHDDARDPASRRFANLLRRSFHWIPAIAESVEGIASTLVHGDKPDSPWRPMPLSMKITLAILLGFSAFNAFCYARGSVTVKPSHRAYFVRLRRHLGAGPGSPTVPVVAHPRSHLALIIGSAALLSDICTMLGWSYGWMSPYGETVLYSGLYAWLPIWVWCLGALAVTLNVWTESRLILAPQPMGRYLKDMFTAGTYGPISRTLAAPLLAYTALTAGFYVFYLINLDSTLPSQVRTLTYLRAMNLTTGVSPAVPLTILAVGLYGWCWYALRGLALLGADRPLLPSLNQLRVEAGRKAKTPYRPLSAESAGEPIEELCLPFHWQTWAVAAGSMLVLLLASQMIAPGIPLRSLGTRRYALIVSLWIAATISLLVANAWQLSQLWLRLRALLDFLDKLPLRRTMLALRGFSWDSIWNMSGNVFDVRYSIFYRQFEAVGHFQSLCAENPARFANADLWLRILDAHLAKRKEFVKWYSTNWDRWWSRDFSPLQSVQIRSAAITGRIFTRILVPAWQQEHESLLLLPPNGSEGREAEAEHMRQSVANLPPEVRAAEEIVCLLYLGFIQNVLGRMRSLVVGMSCLFLSIALMIPSYPFDPRPLLAGSVIVIFLIVGGVVFFVYQGLFRDATLSHITNTKPGELGSEFWLKFISFGIGPIFGLLATVFPQVSDFFFSWLEPSLSSFK